MADDRQLLHHATRMAMVTMVSRVTGYLRDKVLASVLGAALLNDAFRTAFRIPNAFRALLAEGALHAAFVPFLARLGDDDEAARHEARRLVQGLLAVLLVAVAVIVALGIWLSPLLVRLYGEGFADTPGKLEITVVMNRIMFPYLAFISLAALCQGILNSRDRFLLPAATPIVLNLTIAAAAWLVLGRSAQPETASIVLSVAVLGGGLLQLLIQLPAVRRLGFDLRPVCAGFRDRRVRQVLLLMLPGIAVLGINQLNQLITSRLASFLGDGAVTVTYYAYRVTELVFGGIVVQLTTVLLPTLSRELKKAPQEAAATLLRTVRLVSFVTVPTATVLLVAAHPIVGLAFGGGRFSADDVTLTAAMLSAYAIGVVGTGHAKVMAASFFAHRNTRVPMWASGVSLVVFTASAVLMMEPLGVSGLGWANTIAMMAYAGFLTALYLHRFGLSGVRIGPTLVAVARQVAASAVVGLGLVWSRPWLADVTTTSVTGCLKLGAVLGGGAVLYLGLVSLCGGGELAALLDAFRSRAARGDQGTGAKGAGGGAVGTDAGSRGGAA